MSKPMSKSYRICIRKKSGSTLAIVAGCALLIILSIVGGFRLSVYLGSSQEMKNSVDAGALNVAKRVFEIKTANQNLGYDDVTDSQKMIGMANINRVWGKAYLVNANAQSMSQQGYGASGNAPNEASQNARTLNDTLYGMLTNKSSLSAYFNQLVSGKPAKLLGARGSVTAADISDWDAAALYRGEESNIQVKDLQTIPSGVTPNLLTRFNESYMQGYNPSQANGRYFGFVTFHTNEAPHLVANSTFDQWRKVPVSNNPAMTLPNAFKESGQIADQLPLGAVASAVGNPMRTFELTIPHSFVTITLTSIATIKLDDGHGHTTNYPQTPYFSDTGTIQPFKSVDLEKKQYNYPQSLTKWLAVTGLLNGYVSLGNELKPDNLWQAINALPGDHSAAISAILQRVKEFKPGYSQGELQRLLQSQKLVNTGANTVSYFVYPKYSTPDNTDAQVAVGTIGQLPGWLNSGAAPEDQAKVIVKETTQKDQPNNAWSNIIEGQYEVPNKPKPEWPNYSADTHRTALSGTLSWQPGTGWSQCLGVLSINRKTDVIFTGWPTQASSFMDQLFGPVQ